MPDITITYVAFQVESMRNAQRKYFELIAKAKRTKSAEDFKSAKKMLETSKQLEQLVDELVADIRKRTEVEVQDVH